MWSIYPCLKNPGKSKSHVLYVKHAFTVLLYLGNENYEGKYEQRK
jgi:hypothetical protein